MPRHSEADSRLSALLRAPVPWDSPGRPLPPQPRSLLPRVGWLPRTCPVRLMLTSRPAAPDRLFSQSTRWAGCLHCVWAREAAQPAHAPAEVWKAEGNSACCPCAPPAQPPGERPSPAGDAHGLGPGDSGACSWNSGVYWRQIHTLQSQGAGSPGWDHRPQAPGDETAGPRDLPLPLPIQMPVPVHEGFLHMQSFSG